jgi:ppGpp synthetase/RelA/SpoT-type nucleotidyltranferase
MKFEEYERAQFLRYQRFADAVRGILDRAITVAGDIPRPQSIQARAKTPESLKKRLEETDELSADVEIVRRDLAGVRVIFYTNNDVDRFLSSSIVFENFNVERDATKIHHPVEENGETRYSAVHYTVSLNDIRSSLPEYLEFSGLRCEMQIQTILIHAWAETSHDIIYKTDMREKFGNAALTQIRKRFERIMDKYLVPAGYEFQRVQRDYERLVAGKALFDDNLLESLRNAPDNNKRHEQLVALADNVLPLYDDIPSVFPEIVDALVSVVKAARGSPQVPIETPFGSYRGWAATSIIEKVIEILSAYRYVDVERTFAALQDIYIDETDEQSEKSIIEAVGRLAGYNLKAWQQVGPDVQYRLAAAIKAKGFVPKRLRRVFVEVWKRMLEAEATGTTWHASSVSWEAGEVQIAAVAKLRRIAIDALFEFFQTSENDEERRGILVGLDKATRTAARGSSSPDFLHQTLQDQTRIIQFLTKEADGISYELKQTIEHRALYSHYHIQELLGTKGAALGCMKAAQDLEDAILALRDRFNKDPIFCRYKILVGFQGVMPPQWDDRSYDPQKVDRYRDEQIASFLDDVREETKADWLSFLQRCASTRSDDLATFPKLGNFISSLSETKPEIADYLINNGNDDLLRFTPGFLNGLFKSSRPDIYEANLQRRLDLPDYLHSVSKHWRASKPENTQALIQLLERAIAHDNRNAVIDCVLYAVVDTPSVLPPNDDFFRPAIRYLTSVGDTNWTREARMASKPPFLESIDQDDVTLILDNILLLPELDYYDEQILAYIADNYLKFVWNFLGQRLDHAREFEEEEEEEEEERYQAVPSRFQLLARPLSADARMAIEITRGWYTKDSSMFRHRGGRVISAAFLQLPQSLSVLLKDVVENGTFDDAEFVMSIMQNYHGEPATHDVLKAVIKKYPQDEDMHSDVRLSILNSGVLHGEFGSVENARMKKQLIASWLDDDPIVSNFAKSLSKSLDLDIASEQRRAESRSALRRLEYDNDDESDK